MIKIPGLTNGRRGQSVQPETTAIDPGSGWPTKADGADAKLAFILDNVARPEIGFPARLEREFSFANFKRRRPSEGSPTEGGINLDPQGKILLAR
jgi:hypothetical protein